MDRIDPLNFDDAVEDEHAFPCAECGDRCDDRDATNGRIGHEWFCEDCYHAHPAIVGDVMAAILADERSNK